MADNRATVKINSRLHEKMKDIVKMKGGEFTLTDEYELAISNHIKSFYEKELLKDSELEKLLDDKISKIDKHLASMLGRTGMDTSMLLMGLIIFLEHYFEADKNVIFERLRKEGARYYTSSSKKK
jgi:hypothetical protein